MLKGVDVYENDNISDFNILKSQIDVLIQKATQGTGHIDSLLQYRYNYCKAVKIPIGFYHFASYNSTDPVGEAQHFLNTISGLQSDTILWLDIEAEEHWDKQTAINYANAFINYVQSQGFKIGIYTGNSFYYDYLQGNIPDVILWLASYGKEPNLYTQGIASWQYSETGNLDGVIGNIDLDYFQDNILTGQVSQRSYLQKGDNGDRVKEVQQMLLQLGYNLGSYGADGDFGSLTENAIIQFQKKYNLTSEGKVDENTLNELRKKIIEKTQYTLDVPTGDNIFPLGNTGFYIEKRVDGDMGIHRDKGNYIVIRQGGSPEVYWNNNQGAYGSKKLF